MHKRTRVEEEFQSEFHNFSNEQNNFRENILKKPVQERSPFKWVNLAHEENSKNQLIEDNINSHRNN